MRAYIFVAALAIFAFFAPIAARADCGAHDITAAFAPAALALEKIPLTAQNLLGTVRVNPTYGAPYFSSFTNLTQIPTCSDDSDGVRAATEFFGTLWSTGLKARGAQAIARLVATGDNPLQLDKACLPLFHATIRLRLGFVWYNATSDGGTLYPGKTRALTHLPYADHVLSLYRQLAASENLTLTPIGHSGPSNTKLDTDAQAARDHLPGMGPVMKPAIIVAVR